MRLLCRRRNVLLVEFILLRTIPGLLAFAAFPQMPAQSLELACAGTMRVEGQVTDSSGAVIAAARLRLADGRTAVSDAGGQYAFTCVPAGSVSITADADGFASAAERAQGTQGQVVHVDVHLVIATASTSVQVSAETDSPETERGGGAASLTQKDVAQLPDDPDDLLQQLQLLASAGGGGASSATVVVNGFQNGSSMPPKSAIASIRINPDPVAPEYERPGASGGRIEITTKPGAQNYHGAVFFTDSDASFNATDPFSVTSTPAGKRQYGFEFGGPIIAQKSGFSLSLEKRNIDEFSIVNAIALDSNNNQTAERETVSAPQSLWIGSARSDWQLTPNDMITASYDANVNSLSNQGVGGLTLPEAGYARYIAEYDLRAANAWTINSTLLHETRVGYSWKRTQQMPSSTATSLQVAGYFTGGGSTAQSLNNRERDLEIDDDLMLTYGTHTIKLGAQSLGIFVHDYDPETFNGAFVFGGGSAPALDASGDATDVTTTITPMEQYRRALLDLAGGSPTTYQFNTGTALVPYTQWRLALYGEDSFKLRPQLTLTAGLRYTLQTSPGTLANFGPRLGLAWAPGKNAPWDIRFRGGIYNLPIDSADAAQAYQLNGTRQKQTVIYSPNYAQPLLVTDGSISVENRWRFAPVFSQIPVTEYAVGIERDLPHHWHPSVWYTGYSVWDDVHSVNVNAPVVAASTGVAPDPTAALLAPRPGAANLNIFEYQNSAHSRGRVFWSGIEQKGYKRWTLSLGWWSVNFVADNSTPQSSYSGRGESGRPDWQSSGALAEATLKLPYKIEFGSWTYWHYGMPFNITTGTDDNGDGNFNDRPGYATAAGDGVYSTPYGLMTTSAVNGDVPRNLGTMPMIVHMYSNLSRTFTLVDDKDHPRTLAVNARAINLLNHTNVTAVGTVVSSPSLGKGVAAEAARRVELGVRLSF